MNDLWKIAYALIQDGECITAQQWVFELVCDFPNEVMEVYPSLNVAEEELLKEWDKGEYTDPLTGQTKTWSSWADDYKQNAEQNKQNEYKIT